MSHPRDADGQTAPGQAPGAGALTRRDRLSPSGELAGAALGAGAVTGAPARRRASTSDRRVDLAGDLNSSLIKTQGIFNDYPSRVCVEGTKGGEKWSPLSDFKADYAHPRGAWNSLPPLLYKAG